MSFLRFPILMLCLWGTPVTWAAETQTGLSEATEAGIGCLVVSGAAMTVALLNGPSEVVMIAAGGLLVPSAVTPLLVGLTATVALASCSVGSSATPAALWLAEQVGIIGANSNTIPIAH